MIHWWTCFHIRSFFCTGPDTFATNPRDVTTFLGKSQSKTLLCHDRLTSSRVTRATTGSQTSYFPMSDWSYACVCSGGGGNFVLSSSLVGYTTVLGAVAPMVHHGYGFFYRIRDDRWANAFLEIFATQVGFFTPYNSALRGSREEQRLPPIKLAFFVSSVTSGLSSRSQRGSPAATLTPCRCSTAFPAPCTRCTTWLPHLSSRQTEYRNAFIYPMPTAGLSRLAFQHKSMQLYLCIVIGNYGRLIDPKL